MTDVENSAIEDRPRAPTRRVSQMSAGYSRRDGDDLTVAIWSLSGPVALTAFAGIVEVAAAATACADIQSCFGLAGFAVALGIISTIFLTIYLVFFNFSRTSLPERSMLYLSAFLFLWWAAGVGATTFINPYDNDQGIPFFAGTQYFATWCAFLCSGLILHSEWEQFRNMISKMQGLEYSSRSTFYLLLASLVEVISAAFLCGNQKTTCSSQEIYALVVGCLSMVLCILLLRVDREKFQGFDKAICLFLVFWWSIAMGYLTIAGPFIDADNGFFSTWIAFFASFFVAQSRIFPSTNQQ